MLEKKGLGTHEAIIGFMMGIDSTNAIIYGNFIDFQYSRGTVFTLIPEMFKTSESFKSAMNFLLTVNPKIISNSKYYSFPTQTNFFQSLLHTDNSTLSLMNLSEVQKNNYLVLSKVITRYHSLFLRISQGDPKALPPYHLTDGSLLRRSFNFKSMQPIMYHFEEAHRTIQSCMSEL
ncbi:MAG: hypothetical protein V4629_02635 [Pseudomonadota bacterium]